MAALRPGARGAIAAGHPLTAEAGAEILADGGNAFDATIAALWMACVCEPVLASPGGGGFITVQADGRCRVLDFFVTAPRRKRPDYDIEFSEVTVDFGTATQAFHIGAGSTAAPGFVPGLFALHAQLGSLPMRRLVEPAVAAAKAGVAITPLQAYLFTVVAPIYRWTPEAAALFSASGTMPADGETFANPALADALDAIGREGLRIATEGEIAAAMATVSADHGGHLTFDDIAGFAVAMREPLTETLAGRGGGDWRIALNPPPALGGALVTAMLREIAADGADPADPVALARVIEAVDRFWREDPTDPGRLIGTPAAKPSQAAPRGTTHVSVIDADGNAAAATVSNGEGNGRLVPGCGFMLNNMLGEADLNPRGFHGWTPGARLGSMMTPGIATRPDGTMVAFGSGGSNRIRTAILQALLGRCAAGVPLAAAIDAPRLHVESGHLDFEDLFDAGDRERLTDAFVDHRAWPDRNLYFGGVHAVERDARSRLTAAGDPRRGGASRVV